MQRQGIAQSEIVCMFSTLQNLEHTIPTAYGDSESNYGGDRWIIPLQGVYQGNGAGPIIWAVISSPLLEIMRKEGFGTFFKAAIDGEQIRIAGYAFVDDTDLIQTGRTSDATAQEITKSMQEALQMWEGLVRASGGALVVDKSVWWLLDFHWHPDGTWSYATKEMTPADITITDAKGHPVTLDRSEPHEDFETLGVFLAPDGNQTPTFNELMKRKVRPSIANIKAAHLKREDVAYALNSTVMKQIEYVLPATSFSKEQCDQMMKEILHGVLPKAGFVTSYPRNVVYAPYDQIGLNVQHPYTTQLTSQLNILTSHGPRNTITGQLLRNNLQSLSLEIGLPGNALELDYKKWHLLATDSWIVHLWRMIHEYPDLKVNYHCSQLHLQRHNDQFLMELFASAKYSRANLLRLNRCRIWMKAVTVSDLTTGDGKRLLPGILEGKRIPTTWNEYDWPTQGPLPDADWELWRKAITRLVTNRNGISLKQRLGKWLDVPLSFEWPSVYDHVKHHLWIRHQSGWRVYHRQGFLNAEFQHFQELPFAMLMSPPSRSQKTKA